MPAPITRYTQTGTLLSSCTIAVPPGTKRIEALLCGGGGGSVNAVAGGGFGGIAVIEIPITGQPLQVVIGAGAAYLSASPGSPTYVVSAGTRYGEVGGGGTSSTGGGANKNGRSGGGGAGGGTGVGGSDPADTYGGNGGGPPIGKLIWTAYPQDNPNSVTQAKANAAPMGAGTGGRAASTPGTNGSFGGGGGGGFGGIGGAVFSDAGNGGYGGGGGADFGSAGGDGGMGAAAGGFSGTGYGTGGSLASVSIWGYTGFANTSGSPYNRAGPGMLAQGGLGTANDVGGGLGGGGGLSSGGNGFAAIRFYF